MREEDKTKKQLVWELVTGSLIIGLIALLLLASLVHIFPLRNQKCAGKKHSIAWRLSLGRGHYIFALFARHFILFFAVLDDNGRMPLGEIGIGHYNCRRRNHRGLKRMRNT